jgi:hypothetical protein
MKNKQTITSKDFLNARYSVWVGGGEVNDYWITKKQAEYLKLHYKNEGYDDVSIVDNFTNEIIKD